MASLHQTTEGTKTILKWVGIIGTIILIILFLYRIGSGFYQQLFPPPPPKPDLTFGKIPAIIFPQNATDTRFSYTINTIDGKIPVVPALVPVYPIQQYTPTLTSLQNIENIISHSEFAGQPEQELSDTVYSWSESTSPFKKIVIDIVNLDFTLSSQYLGDPNVLAGRNLPDQSGSTAVAKAFFQNMQSYPDDIDETKTTTTLFAVANNTLVPATSLSSSQIIRVDFYQSDRNKMPIFYPHYPNSTINALIASGDGGPSVVEAHYAGKTVLDNQAATYPIISGDEAYQRLQNGQAYIANFTGPSTINHVSITDVILGYYMSDEKKQAYMEPVFAFMGDNGFVAFVSAVQDSYLDNGGSSK